jgi:hypothetical protein|tara:strand:+ start:1242 stop:1454 length:213 start_codon:yes stop_codon:yes gene_type:complete
MATKPKAAIDPDNNKDNNEATWQIRLNMIKFAILKALSFTSVLVLLLIVALSPLYVTMGLMTRQMHEKVN